MRYPPVRYEYGFGYLSAHATIRTHGHDLSFDAGDRPMPRDSSSCTDPVRDIPRLTLDVPEVASALGISRTLAYDLVRQGTLPGVWLTPHRVVVPVDALRRLLESEAQSPSLEHDD